MSILVFLAFYGICWLIYDNFCVSSDCTWWSWVIPLILALCFWVGAIFIGMNINENDHNAYAQKYLIQKETIEMSLENDKLSGFERIELVKQAVELNGELAKRKRTIKHWNSGVLDNTIYDKIEFIKLN
jgi:hypothetical protein